MIQKMAAFTDHFHQTQTGVQVFLVRIEMFNQIVDSGRPICTSAEPVSPGLVA